MTHRGITAGFYHSDIWQRDYPSGMRTIAELLANNPFEVPQHASTYQAMAPGA